MSEGEDIEVEVEQKFVFSLIGDSNIQRNLVDYNCGTREEMRSAQVIPCTSMSTFSGCLPKVRPESTILILSCLSNFLRDSDSATDPGVRFTAVFEKFRSILFPFVSSNPDLYILVAPPQYSTTPQWYSSSIGIALQLLRSLIIDTSGFPNLLLLPAFPNQVLLLVLFDFHNLKLVYLIATCGIIDALRTFLPLLPSLSFFFLLMF